MGVIIEKEALIALLEVQNRQKGFSPDQVQLGSGLPGYRFPYGDIPLVHRVQEALMRVNGHYDVKKPIVAVKEAAVITDLLGENRFKEVFDAIATLANPCTSFGNTKANRVLWETAFYRGVELQNDYERFVRDQPEDLSPRLGFMIPSTVFFETPHAGEASVHQTNGNILLGKKILQFGLWTPPSEANGEEAYQIDGALVPPGSNHLHSLARPW